MTIISDLKSCTKQERIEAFNLLIAHPDTEPLFRTMVKSIVDEVLIASELQPIKRISTIEKVLDLNDMVDHEEEDRELTIPERIQVLEGKIGNNVFVNSEEQESFIPETKLEKTALELIKFACTRPITEGVRAITPKLLHQFRQGILTEELRPQTVNPRQWKKELFELLCDLFPEFKTEKKGNNRGIRLLIPKNFNLCKLNVS